MKLLLSFCSSFIFSFSSSTPCIVAIAIAAIFKALLFIGLVVSLLGALQPVTNGRVGENAKIPVLQANWFQLD